MENGLAEDSPRETKCRQWLKQQEVSGLKIPAFCRQHGLKRSTLYGWRYKLARRDQQPAGNSSFVPVKVSELTSTGCLEILLDRGHRIRLSGPVDRQALLDVVSALEGRAC